MQSPQIRVIIDGQPVMVNTVNEARALAQQQELDLVEVAPNVYKVMDYQKFLYQQRKQHKKQAQPTTKEMRFHLGIAEHDMQRKIQNICQWLLQGNVVRVAVVLRGREQSRPEVGVVLMQRIIDKVVAKQNVAKPVIKTPREGGEISIVLKPLK